MSIELHIHHHDENNAELKEIMDFLKRFRRDIMATLAQFQTALAEIDVETTRLGTLIEELTAKILAGGMSDADEQAALAQLAAAGARLKLVGASVEVPVPPV